MADKIICIGEILWDILPTGHFIGGAPFNVACHLNQLGLGVNMISRVGDDELGKSAIDEMKERELNDKFIQIDNNYPTGKVEVTISDKGNATYNIIEPVAWDFIELTDDIKKESDNSDYLVYGSLAHRNERSSKTIKELFLGESTKILDVNLRYPYYSRELLQDLLSSADIVKMNIDEYNLFSKWFGFQSKIEKGIIEFIEKFKCNTVCVTLGEQGAAIYRNDCTDLHKGYSVNVKDTVGSGDAFLAAMIKGIQNDFSNLEILEFANFVGSYVATQEGATPELLL